MVGEGGAAGDGRGNALPQKTIGVYYILRITVYPRLIFLGMSGVSLRLGRSTALKVHRTFIHYRLDRCALRSPYIFTVSVSVGNLVFNFQFSILNFIRAACLFPRP